MSSPRALRGAPPTAALDTSAAVAYLMRAHEAHTSISRRLRGERPTLTEHSLAETYSVLTRLPGDARVAPLDAARLLATDFGRPCRIPDDAAVDLPARLAPLGIAGGAVYDALVGLAAGSAGLPLLTRDRRAASTYGALGIAYELVPG